MHHGLKAVALGLGSMFLALSALGDCSGENDVPHCTESELRAAMQRGGLIRICCDGEIVLARAIDVTNSVALYAQNSRVVISGGNRVRLFNVSPGTTFALTNIVLANGLHAGAAGTNAPSGQRAQDGFPGEGGAIYNAGGTVQLTGCVLTNNRAIGGAGGNTSDPRNRGLGGIARGGALANVGGTLILSSIVCVSNNVIGGTGGFDPGDVGGVISPPNRGGDALGGALWSMSGSVTINDSQFRDNSCEGGWERATARGGAIHQESNTLSIVQSSLIANRAQGRSAGPNGAPGYACGGAIYSSAGAILLDHVIMRNNTARGGDAFRHFHPGEALGGAIYSEATLVVHDSDVSANEARAGSGSTTGDPDAKGGALYLVGGTTLSRSTFGGNLARGSDASGIGGGIWTGSDGVGGAILNNGVLGVTNCTFALNLAQGGNPSLSGQGFSGSAYGGGIFNTTSGRVECVNVTIASNSVSRGFVYYGGKPFPAMGGEILGANIANTNGSFILRNSILAHGFNGTNAWTNAWGIITDGGFNLSSDSSANFTNTSSFNSTDPRLGPLADNGGPTFTLALMTNSPAIDTGGNAGAPAMDQRGLPRPYGNGVDIGAFELQPPRPRLTVARADAEQIVIGFAAGTNSTYRLQSAPAITSEWMDLENFGPFPGATNILRTFSTGQDAARYFRVASP